MKITLSENALELGERAADLTAKLLNEAIEKNGSARLVLSTGASQFETIAALIKKEIDWSKVEVFHLDEYVDLPITHPASFRKYIKERFGDFVNAKEIHYVNTDGDIEANIASLTAELRKAPVDVALIGIGENAHIAFNDPPADFENENAYIIVNLDQKCRQQQLGEGWFPTINDVPKQAVSMTVKEIMKSKVIVSSVPHKVKAQAIKDTLENDLTPNIPATMLKQHANFNLFVDKNSASSVAIDQYLA
ncbi:MAG: glucosamine-6-phosphate deaminase [Clostridiales bacterium]|nr:glucosamine-6-phosphate deaminase [Clostridiales bacterium]